MMAAARPKLALLELKSPLRWRMWIEV